MPFRVRMDVELVEGDFLAHDHTLRDVALVGPFAERKQLFDLSAQVRLQGEQVLVTDGMTLGGIGVDLGPVQADGAQLQHPCDLGQQQHLDEQVLQGGEERLAKGRQRVVVGVEVAGDKAERHRLERRPFKLARTEHARGVAIEQQSKQDFGRIGLAAAGAVAGVDGRQVELGDRVHNETCHVVGRHTVAQPYRQVQSCFVINGFEGSAHTRQYSTGGPGGSRFLSDRLLDSPCGSLPAAYIE